MTKETPSDKPLTDAERNAIVSKQPDGVVETYPGDKGARNARHAATFPPDTPHSVINAFPGHVDVDKVLYADPRNAEKVVELKTPRKTEVVVSPVLTDAQRGSVSSESSTPSDAVIVETVTPK
jgi:hypothetical protein